MTTMISLILLFSWLFFFALSAAAFSNGMLGNESICTLALYVCMMLISFISAGTLLIHILKVMT